MIGPVFVNGFKPRCTSAIPLSRRSKLISFLPASYSMIKAGIKLEAQRISYLFPLLLQTQAEGTSKFGKLELKIVAWFLNQRRSNPLSHVFCWYSVDDRDLSSIESHRSLNSEIGVIPSAPFMDRKRKKLCNQERLSQASSLSGAIVIQTEAPPDSLSET